MTRESGNYCVFRMLYCMASNKMTSQEMLHTKENRKFQSWSGKQVSYLRFLCSFPRSLRASPGVVVYNTGCPFACTIFRIEILIVT